MSLKINHFNDPIKAGPLAGSSNRLTARLEIEGARGAKIACSGKIITQAPKTNWFISLCLKLSFIIHVYLKSQSGNYEEVNLRSLTKRLKEKGFDITNLKKLASLDATQAVAALLTPERRAEPAPAEPILQSIIEKTNYLTQPAKAKTRAAPRRPTQHFYYSSYDQPPLATFLNSSEIKNGSGITLDLILPTHTKGDFRIWVDQMAKLDIKSLRIHGLKNEEVNILVQALPRMTNLRTLDLAFNNINDAGAKELAKIDFSKIDLNVKHNQIQTEGALALVHAMKNHKKEIDLSHNKIGDNGALAVTLILQHFPGKVEMLKLKANGITDAGDKGLAKFLPSQIKVVYRYNKTTLAQEHPKTSAGIGMLFPPFFFMAALLPLEHDIEGTVHPREAR